MRPSAPRRPASRCESSTTSGGRRPTRPTSPTPSSSSSPRTRRRASTTSSTACSRRAPTGPATSSAGPASRSSSSTSRRRPGSARRGRRAGASSRRRRCRRASRCASWPDAMADYAPALLRAPAGPRHERDSRAAPPRRCPASATGRSPATATRAAPSASCGAPGRSRTRPSSRPTCPPRPPGVLRGLHLHRRQDDLWIVAEGRAFVALVDVRPALAGGAPAVVETRELGADDWVYIPTGVAHGFLALEPLQLIYLVTNEYDGVGRARIRLGRSGGRRALAGPRDDPRRTPDPVRA